MPKEYIILQIRERKYCIKKFFQTALLYQKNNPHKLDLIKNAEDK